MRFKYLKTSILLLLINYSFAQLSVRNDTYLFVSDEVLFVEDNINLQEANSNIYLRNEAQLLQGSGTTGNSGIGKLSVFQSGSVNQYAYNYWCSPVGNIDTNDFLNRPFRANNQFYDFTGDPDPLLNPITSAPATFTNSPDGNSSPLEISSVWLYSFDAGLTYFDWDYLGSTGSLTTGYGFTMKGTAGSGNNQLYDFRGKPNNGTITTTVIDGHDTLVGNPYPSALDALAYIHDPQNVNAMTGDLFFWEQNVGANSHNLADYVGGYATYTISSAGVDSFTPAPFSFYSNTGIPLALPFPQNGVKIARRYIAVGQGFLIEGSPGTTGTVYTRNSHRAYYSESDPDSNFFRTANNQGNEQEDEDVTYNEHGLNIVPDDFKRFRINADLEETYTRQLLLNFHDTATNDYDYGLEGRPSNVLASDAYFNSTTTPLNIQAFSFDEDLTIPVILKTEFQQLVTFRIFDIQNFSDTQPIYLHDILNDTYTDLRVQNHQVTLPQGLFEDRFEITFNTSNTLNTIDEELDSFTIFQNNSNNYLIFNNPNRNKVNSIELFDVSGKLILRTNEMSSLEEYAISSKSFSDGVYLVKVVFENLSEKTKKVIISNKK